jgi:hypothetical protein
MRSYSALILFENIFEFIPDNNPDIANFATMIFNPNVAVTQADCGTTLGKIQAVNYELEGETELATGEVISKARIEQLLFQGIYRVATRSLDTCVAPGGICQKCFAASRPRHPIPEVGTRVTINPEYEITTTVFSGAVGQENFPLELDESEYQFLYVYIQGVLLPESSYSVSGKTLTLAEPLTVGHNITVKYTALNRSPFLVWLAKTYSGSLLGIKPLPAPKLPVRSELLTSLVPQNRLDLLISYTNTLEQIPQHYREYMPQIKHPLERALYMLALNSVFANVTS